MSTDIETRYKHVNYCIHKLDQLGFKGVPTLFYSNAQVYQSFYQIKISFRCNTYWNNFLSHAWSRPVKIGFSKNFRAILLIKKAYLKLTKSTRCARCPTVLVGHEFVHYQKKSSCLPASFLNVGPRALFLSYNSTMIQCSFNWWVWVVLCSRREEPWSLLLEISCIGRPRDHED
jgi:hypothetical protein